MTKNQMIKIICSNEGKKTQVSVANVREVLKVLQKQSKDWDFFKALVRYILAGK